MALEGISPGGGVGPVGYITMHCTLQGEGESEIQRGVRVVCNGVICPPTDSVWSRVHRIA